MLARQCPLCFHLFDRGDVLCSRHGEPLATVLLSDLAGSTVDDRYLLVREHSRSADSVIFRAENKNSGRAVALRLELIAVAESERGPVTDYMRYAVSAISLLDHPNIVRTTDCGITDSGAPYVVWDWVDGPSLSQVLESSGTLDTRRLTRLGSALAAALEHAHRRQVVPVGISPCGIILARDDDDAEIPVLIPGAIFRRLPWMLSQAGLSCLESVAYASPERCLGRRLDERDDIYALGAILYRCAAGHPPFSAGGALDVMISHVREKPVLLSYAASDVQMPQALSDLVMQMLEKSADARPRSAGSLAAALKTQLAQVEGAGTGDECASITLSEQPLNIRMRWLRHMASAGDVRAQSEIARNYRMAKWTPADYMRALYWHLRASAAGDRESAYWVGCLYEMGLGVERCDSEAFAWFLKAALAGDYLSRVWLSYFYMEGRAVAADDALAFYWAVRSAESGEPAGLRQVGFVLHDADSPIGSQERAIPWIKQAAESGDHEAMFWMGLCLEKGRGTDCDPAAAAHWYRQTAAAGHARAQYRLAMLYKNGCGVERDEDEFAHWIEKSAEAGDKDAGREFGIFLAGRADSLCERQAAASWLERAACADDGEARRAYFQYHRQWRQSEER